MSYYHVVCYKRISTNEIAFNHYRDFKELRRFEAMLTGEFNNNIWNDFLILKEADVRSKVEYSNFIKKCKQHNFYIKK